MWAAGERVRGGIRHERNHARWGLVLDFEPGGPSGISICAKTRIAGKVGDGRVQDINGVIFVTEQGREPSV